MNMNQLIPVLNITHRLKGLIQSAQETITLMSRSAPMVKDIELEGDTTKGYPPIDKMTTPLATVSRTPKSGRNVNRNGS